MFKKQSFFLLVVLGLMLGITPFAAAEIEITDVSVPATIVEGSVVNVGVTVANNDALSESVNVSVIDETETNQIGSDTVDIPGSSSVVVNFSWDTTGALYGEHSLLAIAIPLSTNLSVSTYAVTTVTQPPTHDNAVTGISAPSTVTQGDVVSVDVSVQNQGTFTETTDVELSLGASLIDSQSVTLAPGGSQVVNFVWDSSSAPIGNQTLTGTIVAVAGETELSDNSASTGVEVLDPNPVTVDVTLNSVTANDTGKKRKYNVQANASNPNNQNVTVTFQCTIYDASGTNPLQSLVDKTVTIRKNRSKTVKWTDAVQLPKGNYVAKVTIVEDPLEAGEDSFTVKK